MSRVFRFAGRALINALMLVFSLFCVFPFVWMIYSGLKTESEFAMSIIALPKQLYFDNFIYVFGKLYRYMINSAITSLFTVVGVLVLAFVSGYFLSRFRFKLRNLIYGVFMFGMLVPVVALMVPIFVQFKTVNLLDKPVTLFIVYVATGMPMAVFLIESFLYGIPIEMEEAAIIDGCGLFRAMFAVVFPLCLPVLSTVLILSFNGAWNEFSFALVLISKDTLRTLPVSLRDFNSMYTVQYTQLMAALCMATVPVILIYLLAYKKIIIGMTAGALKG